MRKTVMHDANGLETVKTSPCPRCHSLNTQAQLLNLEVLWRICCSCLHEWDVTGDCSPILSHRERLRLILRGGIKNEAQR